MNSLVLKSAVATLLLFSIAKCEEIVNRPNDSYLAALKNSQENKIAREDNYPVYSGPSNDYLQTPAYSQPQDFNYSPTSASYSNQHFGSYQSYGPPAPSASSYNQAPSYGPPAYGYGPSSTQHHHHHEYNSNAGTPYGAPAHWILSKIKAKLNLFTLGKILLKLVIFHKIIKFIGLICLLLFLPSLKPHEDTGDNGDDLDEGYRVLNEKDILSNRLDEISRVAHIAIAAFSRKNDSCSSGDDNSVFTCRLHSMIDMVDNQYPYIRIADIIHLDERNEIE